MRKETEIWRKTNQKPDFLDLIILKSCFYTKGKKVVSSHLMTSPTMPPTPMTPHNYPIGHHKHSSMTRIGRKWLINMFFQDQPPQPPIPHTNTPQRPTNVFQISYVINHGSPHPHDPTQLPYRSPQLLIRDKKWKKIVQKHGFFYLCLHKVTFHT